MSEYIERAETLTLPVVISTGIVAFPGIPVSFELNDTQYGSAVAAERVRKRRFAADILNGDKRAVMYGEFQVYAPVPHEKTSHAHVVDVIWAVFYVGSVFFKIFGCIIFKFQHFSYV